MEDLVVSIVVNVLVGLTGAFVGVVLGTRFERRRAKAERLYCIKQETYLNISSAVHHVEDLMEELFTLTKLEDSFGEEIPEDFWHEIDQPFVRDNRELKREVDHGYELMLESETPGGDIKSAGNLLRRVLNEGLEQLSAACGKIAGKYYLLDLIDVPAKVKKEISKPGNVVVSICDSIFRLRGDATREPDRSSRRFEEMLDTYRRAIARMKRAMKDDLDRTL